MSFKFCIKVWMFFHAFHSTTLRQHLLCDTSVLLMVDSPQLDLLQFCLFTCSISVSPLPSLANYCASVVRPGDPSPSVLPAADERSCRK